MSATVQLFEDHCQRGAALEVDRLSELHDGSMVLADFRIDAPGRGRIAVERVRDRPALLVEVRSRILQRDLVPTLRVGTGFRTRCWQCCREDFDLAEVQIAVVLSARAAMCERIVCQHLQSQAGDAAQCGVKHEGVGIFLWPHFPGENGPVRLLGQRRTVRRLHLDRFEHLPERRHRGLFGLPGGGELLRFGCQQ